MQNVIQKKNSFNSNPEWVMTKTIKISQSTHDALSELASKKDTFNDVINYLINYYKENEEFTDEELIIIMKRLKNLNKETLNKSQK